MEYATEILSTDPADDLTALARDNGAAVDIGDRPWERPGIEFPPMQQSTPFDRFLQNTSVIGCADCSE